jgi:hypothetical protein
MAGTATIVAGGAGLLPGGLGGAVGLGFGVDLGDGLAADGAGVGDADVVALGGGLLGLLVAGALLAQLRR